jgi:tetraacyldisaccharide 4'-kinase
MGECPAILSRGYARTRTEDGVVVVRDPAGIRADLDRAGDEPLMLARRLPGASVLVSSDRYLAGCLAEHHLGATVHVLDDGFQHLQLERDLDILMIGRDDIARPETLPGGRLREPLDTFIAADAILAVDDGIELDMRGLQIPVFKVKRALGTPVPARETALADLLAGDGAPPVVAVAGIAAPERFFADLRAAGYAVAHTMTFRDHHPYSRRDVERIVSAARSAGAQVVLTTEKDFVRLLPHRPFSMPVAWVPLTMEPDPLPDFRRWLAGSVGAVRDIIVG